MTKRRQSKWLSVWGFVGTLGSAIFVRDTSRTTSGRFPAPSLFFNIETVRQILRPRRVAWVDVVCFGANLPFIFEVLVSKNMQLAAPGLGKNNTFSIFLVDNDD